MDRQVHEHDVEHMARMMRVRGIGDEVQEFLSPMQFAPGMRVLEAGAGAGYASRYLCLC